MEDATTNVQDEVLDGMTVTHSNLRCFLDTVTPTLQTYSDVKQYNDVEKIVRGVKYFYLGDLWSKFYELSACGVGISVCLPSGEAIVQYFVPYLSAIQLYANESNDPALQSNSIVSSMTSYGAYNKHTVIDSHIYKIEDERSTSMCKGELFFKYFELDSPYERMPFTDKMYQLCCETQHLPSMRSIDLSPSSWMSIFWYPLCHVPARNKKDLSTCFLTYHSLSTSQDCVVQSGHASNYVTLAPFGLATHKLDTEVWASQKSGDQKHIASLIEATQSWIKKHDIQHHDYNFFSQY